MGKNAFPQGVKVFSRGVYYLDFLPFQRGNSLRKQRSSTGGVWFLNVIAHFVLSYNVLNTSKVSLLKNLNVLQINVKVNYEQS